MCDGAGLDDSSAVEGDFGSTVGTDEDGVPVGVDFMVMFRTQQRCILQTRSPALSPVLNVMRLGPGCRF